MTNEKNEVMTMEEAGKTMQDIIDKCIPATTGQTNDIMALLQIGDGIVAIRNILDRSDIKNMIQAMQNTALGFLTDRPPAAVEASKDDRNKKTIVAYTWVEIRDCIAEALLKGYRCAGNEFNIIAGRFYATQVGKFRHINEWPGISNFTFSNSTPNYTTEIRKSYGKDKEVSFADIEVMATWIKDGKKHTLGRIQADPSTHTDRQVFRIKAHGGDDDAVVGKALSKLFTRVLMRISGQIIPESDDISSDDEVIDGEITNQDTKASIEPEDNFNNDKAKDSNTQDGDTFLTCPVKFNKSQPKKALAICEGCKNGDDCDAYNGYLINRNIG